MAKTKKTTNQKLEKSQVKASGDLFTNSQKTEIEISHENVLSENSEELSKMKTSVEINNRVVKSKKTFDLSDCLFLEIHKSNLLQYFSSGCIYPSKYSSQKAFPDPQTINENGLLISNGIFSDNKDHILIQIDAMVIDTVNLSVSNDFGFYTGVIPISRIIKLFVQDEETKKKTLDNSLIRDSGIIPDSLIEVGFPSNLSKVDYVDISIDHKPIESKLIHFDKILGLIAGTRNFNLLTCNQTGKYKSIADHSLYAVQAIDETFAKEIVDNRNLSEYYKWLFTKSCPNDRPALSWLFNRIYDNANFTEADTNEFESVCYKTNSFPGEENQIKNIFSALRKSLERKKVFKNILALQSKNSLALYVFAYLRNFGTTQNPELARLELINSNVNKFTEYAFATLNFFFGYKQLRNSEDRISLSDEAIKKIVKNPVKPVIKFELTTEFDYRIIDIVFNFVFDIKKNNDFSKYKNIMVEQSSLNISLEGYDCNSNNIYGKSFLNIIKSDIVEKLIKLPNEITIFSEFGLLCHRSGLKRNFIGFEELIGNPKSILRFVYYSKADLIDAIKENKIDIEEINQRITLSKKYKEL